MSVHPVIFTNVEGGMVQAQLTKVPGVIAVGAGPRLALLALLDAAAEYILSLTDGPGWW